MNNVEAVLELNITPAAASKRYIRSLTRLKKIMDELSDEFESL